MKLKNILFVVDDMEKSKQFYREIFGLQVILDFGENVTLSEGLVLQERRLWEKFTGREVSYHNNDAELYFEENDMDGFVNRLESSAWDITYVNELMMHDWGQRVVRICDPDGHVIEVGEAMEYVVRRMLESGMSVEAAAAKSQMPPDVVEGIAKQRELER